MVEAFKNMPDMELYLCGPNSEQGFFDVLGETIAASQNIHYEGFVQVGGERFKQLLSMCAFVMFASSSEGCATSVATAMRGGVVPILNNESGISVGDFGFKLSGPSEGMIGEIMEVSRRASSITDEDYRKRAFETLKESLKYTQASFTQTFSTAIIRVLQEREFDQIK